ncbi:hypothetical protein Musp01_26780 [Muricauda sp. NBRC 101325]|nr:hypothetical protein Musp01_26780 [Muricauda sp. NBRC 101325]
MIGVYHSQQREESLFNEQLAINNEESTKKELAISLIRTLTTKFHQSNNPVIKKSHYSYPNTRYLN